MKNKLFKSAHKEARKLRKAHKSVSYKVLFSEGLKLTWAKVKKSLAKLEIMKEAHQIAKSVQSQFEDYNTALKKVLNDIYSGYEYQVKI